MLPVFLRSDGIAYKTLVSLSLAPLLKFWVGTIRACRLCDACAFSGRMFVNATSKHTTCRQIQHLSCILFEVL